MKTGGYARSERLRGRGNFSRFARARQYREGVIRAAVLFAVDGKAVEGRRAAFVVSKKVSNRAVDRNRLKRQLRELYRKCRTLLPENIWLMFIALPEALAYAGKFDKLEKDFVALCKRVAAQNAGNPRNKAI